VLRILPDFPALQETSGTADLASSVVTADCSAAFLTPQCFSFLWARQAVAQERWLREQIEIAVKEADDSSAEWIQHKVVRAEWERERAALLAESEHEQNS